MTETPPRDAASLEADALARVSVRPVDRLDAAELVAANQRNRQLHQPWIHPPTDEPGFLAWFQGGVTGPHLNLVAHERATGALVGVVSLENIVCGAFWNADLSYYGMAATSGRGLMTAALRLAVRHGFTRLDLHRVQAAVRPENGASARLLRRLGFRHEGRSPEYLWVDGAWRDHDRYALLRREFAAPAAALP